MSVLWCTFIYYFVVTQLKNRSLAGAILVVRKGQTQEQNLTNKQKSVQKLCIRFFVVKSITVFNESKWLKWEGQPSSFPLKRDHWIFSGVCKNTWKQRYRKTLRKRPNSYTFVRCFCVCPHSDPIRENYLKTWQGGGWEWQSFGKCELTLVGRLFGGGSWAHFQNSNW